MSLALKPLTINNKKELISLATGQFREDPYSINILDERVGTRESGFADLLGVDKEGHLVLIYVSLSANDSAIIPKSLSNYYWACENILNIKKMYPQANINTSASPKAVYLSRLFSKETKKTLSFLDIATQAFQFQGFEVNGIPCLYLEKIALSESKDSFWDLELEKLKKEFSGKEALSEEELEAFINFEQGSSSE